MNHLRLNSILAATLIAVILAGMPLSTAADNTSRRVIVGFRDTPGLEQRQMIESLGGRVLYQYDFIKAIAAELPNRAASSLAQNNRVTYVETEQYRQMETHLDPGVLWDGSYEILPWGINAVQADEVWDSDHNLMLDAGSITGQGVSVAVLDSGIQLGHEDLAGNLDLANSFDFLDNDADVSDIPGPVTGHGTATSGIVAAVENTVGVIGVAPKATIIMYRVCDSALNECPDSAIIAALQQAITDGADVASMSFGGIGFSIPFKQAIHAADQAGIVLVASAGNTPSQVAGARHYPSGFSEVISVGATDINNNLATFSTFGGHQDLVAPGVGTPTAFLNGQGRDSLLEENSPTAQQLQNNPMAFTATGSETRDLVFAGFGSAADFASVDCTNKIALVSRGAGLTFRTKTLNAIADGCKGVIVHNNVAGNFFGTLSSSTGITVPVVSVSQANGLALRAELNSGAVNVDLAIVALNYESFSGTSASAPHVSGVVALVLDADPSLSSKDVKKILYATATDLGEPGRDTLFGYGLVNAKGAVDCAQGTITCLAP
jgi:subtilisin family serine protease